MPLNGGHHAAIKNQHGPGLERETVTSDQRYHCHLDRRLCHCSLAVWPPDTRRMSRVIANAAEAQAPEARKLIGKDAEAALSMTPAEFEQAIVKILNSSDL